MRHVGHLPRHYCPSFSFGRVENGGGSRREKKVAANGEGGGGPSEEEAQSLLKPRGVSFRSSGFETFVSTNLLCLALALFSSFIREPVVMRMWEWDT